MGTITHQFVSALPDDPDATLVRPSNWNDTHTFALTGPDVGLPVGGDITGNADGIAIGFSSSALGAYSMAVGHDSTATGVAAVAVGRLASATAAGATAIGFSSVAGGIDTVVIGVNAVSNVDYSVAIGVSAAASGSDSVAIGEEAQSGGAYSAAVGAYASSAGLHATAIGNASSAFGSYSIAIGNGCGAIEESSIAIGLAADSYNAHSVALGDNTETTRDFEVSIGGSGGNRLLAGVSSGLLSTDAVNLGQLTTAISAISLVKGTVDIDFGASPGLNQTSVVVTGQTNIVAGSDIVVGISAIATANNTIDDVKFLASQIGLSAGTIVPGTSFTIYANSAQKIQGLITLTYIY